MGYHSQVGIALSKSAFDNLERKLALVDNKTRSAVVGFLDSVNSYKHSDDGSRGYVWNLIKWYDDEPEVKFFSALFADLDCADYLFVRVGEDMDDSERRGCFFKNPFDLNLVRRVEMK